VLDASLEDGGARDALDGIFHPGLPVVPLATALERLAVEYPKIATTGILYRRAMQKARQIEDRYPALTLDEVASIVLYTIEDKERREDSPYYVMNAALREKVRLAVRAWRDYIWLLMHALRKLPPAMSEDGSPVRMVMRGCKDKSLAELGIQVQPTKEVVWAGFSSAATTVDVMDTFLGQDGMRVKFDIQLAEPFVACDLRPFSLYPAENEVLLPPNTTFQVVSKYSPAPDFHIVQYKQIESLDGILDLSYVGPPPAIVSPSVLGGAAPSSASGPAPAEGDRRRRPPLGAPSTTSLRRGGGGGFVSGRGFAGGAGGW
jgi:hypothetical protein